MERRHDERPVRGLPAIRPPVRTVVASERAVTQGLAHGVTNRCHVIDFWRESRLRPQPPAQGDIAGVTGAIEDPLSDVASYELRLDGIHARHAVRAVVVVGELPCTPLAVSARPAVGA